MKKHERLKNQENQIHTPPRNPAIEQTRAVSSSKSLSLDELSPPSMRVTPSQEIKLLLRLPVVVLKGQARETTTQSPAKWKQTSNRAISQLIFRPVVSWQLFLLALASARLLFFHFFSPSVVDAVNTVKSSRSCLQLIIHARQYHADSP